MDNKNICSKTNRCNEKRKFINKQNIWATLQIIAPLLLTIIYLKGFLIALELPSNMTKYIHLDKLGETGVILRLTYWSNLIILIWTTIGTSIFSILLVIHCLKGNKRKDKLNTLTILQGKIILSIILVAFMGFLSFVYLQKEKVIDIVKRYDSDIILLKSQKTEVYEGMIEERVEQEIEGGYYAEKPKPLKILNSYKVNTNEKCKRFLCPKTLLKNIKLKKDKYYRIYYLPNSRIVVSIENINKM
ncbi:hypothetical protein [Clostridium brassicae]|uniref:Uncharacterized protein n=1 Tax=Clostridium brassicae TaxID=2999072 RepID=A0ABT4D6D3_9CLOT|nr:hypothetical protein [Clostridium brassicae]MCY6957743.1 hypothetical protein [Clostridium brassicae]